MCRNKRGMRVLLTTRTSGTVPFRSAMVIALAACSHSEPFGPSAPPPFDGAATASVPVRLTFEAGEDGFPSWSPDGRQILYSFQPRDRHDADRCIGVIPGKGGTREEFCDNSGPGATRTDALEYPTVNTAGGLLYARYASGIGDFIPITDQISLQLADMGDPLRAQNLLPLPTQIDGVGLTRIGTIRWADTSTFYLVAEQMTLTRNPFSLAFQDTVISGNGLLRGRLTASGATFEAVAGIVDANGFDFSAGRDSVFFTRTGDNRLYVVSLAGSSARVVYALPQQLPGLREIRNPVRIGPWVAAITQDIDTSQPPRFTAGLAPNAKIELIRTSDGTSQVLRNGAGQVPAFGRLAVSPDGCTLVVEFREPRRISFTTDLYAICLGPGGSCTCA